MCIVAAATVGAEPDEQPNPLQQYADDFVGTWEYVWTAKKDHEKGNWKAGDKLPLKCRVGWDLEQAALGWELGATLPITNKRVIWSKGFCVWNPETELVTLYSFGVNGSIRQQTYCKQGDAWVTETLSVNRKAEKKTSKSKIEVKDNGNTHMHYPVDDESKEIMIWKRMDAAEE